MQGPNSRSRYLNSGLAEMGSEKWEIGASIVGDPVFASSPIVHETREHHRLILAQESLHELLITQFFAVQPLYAPDDSQTHLEINTRSRSRLDSDLQADCHGVIFGLLFGAAMEEELRNIAGAEGARAMQLGPFS